MSTLNVCVQIYMNKKNTQIFFKIKYFFEKKRNICNFNKVCVFFYSYVSTHSATLM